MLLKRCIAAQYSRGNAFSAVCCSVLQCVAVCCSVLHGCNCTCNNLVEAMPLVLQVQLQPCTTNVRLHCRGADEHFKSQFYSHFRQKIEERADFGEFLVIAKGRIHLRSARKVLEIQLFKVGLGVSRTNTDSPWNPVYKALDRIRFCGNDPIAR